MTATADMPTERPTDDADVRFAACLADIAAHVDDPELGEEYQALLNDDPENQRALFDLAEAMAAAPGPLPGSLLWMAGAPLVVIAMVVIVVRFLS